MKKETIHRLQAVAASLMVTMAMGAQSNVTTQWTADELKLDFRLSEPKDAGRDYAVCTTPIVTNGTGDTLRLQPTIFRGSRNEHYTQRARYYGNEAPASKQEVSLGDTVSYATTISRASAPWLWQPKAVNVGVEREKEGCCNVENLPAQQLARTVYVPTFVPAIAYVKENSGRAGELAYDNPILQPYTKYEPYKMRRVMGAEYVYFPLDRSILRRDFRDNAATLDRIIGITRDIMADTLSTVKLIQIVGQASVEGPYKHNLDLGRWRGEALKRYVQDRVPTPDSLYEVVNGGEGWGELREQIAQSDIEWRDALLDIIDNEPNADRREARIKKYDGGRAYRYLLKNVLRDQRNSGYIRIYYTYERDEWAEDINSSIRMIKEGRVAEGRDRLLKIGDDPRVQNPLGVAYYLLGDEQEALSRLTRAAQDGNAEAQENLRQIEAIKQAKAAL